MNQGQVITFFGGKEALFLEAVGRFKIQPGDLTGGIEDMGARLARLYMDRWEHMATDDPWPALVRSALSHEPSAKLLDSALAEQYASLREVLGDTEEGRLRMSMVSCLLAGMIMERYLYAQEPARSIPANVFESALAAALQHAISGPLTT